jgi:hypothetical protein
MRQRRLSQDEIEAVRQLRNNGATYQTLAELQGCSKKTVYDAINGRKPPRPANDNNPSRMTRFAPHNGGCSTASGLQPVSLARVPTLDAPTVPLSAREMAVAA